MTSCPGLVHARGQHGWVITRRRLRWGGDWKSIGERFVLCMIPMSIYYGSEYSLRHLDRRDLGDGLVGGIRGYIFEPSIKHLGIHTMQ